MRKKDIFGIFSLLIIGISLLGIIFSNWPIQSSIVYILFSVCFLWWIYYVWQSLYYAVKSTDPKDNIKILSALGIIATPFIVGFIGYQVQSAISTQAIDRDYVRIAVSVLQDKDADESLREWALKMLSAKSPLPFGNNVQQGFMDGTTSLPSSLKLDDYLQWGDYSMFIPTSTPLNLLNTLQESSLIMSGDSVKLGE